MPVQIIFQDGELFRVLHTLDCNAWGGYGYFVSTNITRLGATAALSANKLAVTIFAPYRYASTVYNYTTNDTGKLNWPIFVSRMLLS